MWVPTHKSRLTLGQSVQSQLLRAWKLGLTTLHGVPSSKSPVWHGCLHGNTFWKRVSVLMLRVKVDISKTITGCITCIHVEATNVCMWYIRTLVVLGSVMVLGIPTLGWAKSWIQLATCPENFLAWNYQDLILMDMNHALMVSWGSKGWGSASVSRLDDMCGTWDLGHYVNWPLV